MGKCLESREDSFVPSSIFRVSGVVDIELPNDSFPVTVAQRHTAYRVHPRRFCTLAKTVLTQCWSHLKLSRSKLEG